MIKEIVKCCGFIVDEAQEYDKEEYEKFFNEVMRYPSLQKFSLPLYLAGVQERNLKAEFEAKRESDEFADQDSTFQKWERLCRQLKDIMSIDSDDMQFFYSRRFTGRERIESPNPKLHSLIVAAQSESLTEFETENYGDQTTHLYPINSETINKRIELIEELNKKIYEGKTRKISDPLRTAMQFVAQRLALLTKVQTYLNSDYATIDKVPMSDNGCQFIHDYLIFFDLNPPVASGDNTSTNVDLIKTMLRQFPKNESIYLKLIAQFKASINNLESVEFPPADFCDK
ncbi:MAG: hypothetical protein SNG49_07755 [Rikenellaceae bacterium]